LGAPGNGDVICRHATIYCYGRRGAATCTAYRKAAARLSIVSAYNMKPAAVSYRQLICHSCHVISTLDARRGWARLWAHVQGTGGLSRYRFCCIPPVEIFFGRGVPRGQRTEAHGFSFAGGAYTRGKFQIKIKIIIKFQL
jgi:hypothetical protein